LNETISDLAKTNVRLATEDSSLRQENVDLRKNENTAGIRDDIKKLIDLHSAEEHNVLLSTPRKRRDCTILPPILDNDEDLPPIEDIHENWAELLPAARAVVGLRKHAPYVIKTASIKLTRFVRGFVTHYGQIQISPDGNSKKQETFIIKKVMEYIKGFFTAADNAFILQDGPPAEAFSERSAWLKSQDAVIDRVVADVLFRVFAICNQGREIRPQRKR